MLSLSSQSNIKIAKLKKTIRKNICPIVSLVTSTLLRTFCPLRLFSSLSSLVSPRTFIYVSASLVLRTLVSSYTSIGVETSSLRLAVLASTPLF